MTAAPLRTPNSSLRAAAGHGRNCAQLAAQRHQPSPAQDNKSHSMRHDLLSLLGAVGEAMQHESNHRGHHPSQDTPEGSSYVPTDITAPYLRRSTANDLLLLTRDCTAFEVALFSCRELRGKSTAACVHSSRSATPLKTSRLLKRAAATWSQTLQRPVCVAAVSAICCSGPQTALSGR